MIDVRRRGDLLSETVGYMCKPPEFESVEKEAESLTALKGACLMQPFGSLHGNVSEVPSMLECLNCGRAAVLELLRVSGQIFDGVTLATPHEGPAAAVIGSTTARVLIK